jgi:hypothetical protein
MNLTRSRFGYPLAASVSCAALFVVLIRSGLPQDVKGVERTVDLQRQRVAALEGAHEVISSRLKSGRETLEIAVLVEKDLLVARLAVAQNQQDRIKACDAAIDNAKEILEAQRTFFNENRISKAGVFVAESLLLEAQIEREKAMTGH